jgi:nucleoside-diphosphate-sugar epimerase
MKKVLVTGAGGFIGGHLVKSLIAAGNHVRAIDIKPLNEWFQVENDAQNIISDMRDTQSSAKSCDGIDTVYNLASDMGGMGFIENHKAECMVSVLINTNLLEASRKSNVERYFYSSSACVYNGTKQQYSNVTALKESDAYPADPEDGYGWEKLFSERMCRHFREDYGIQTRVARFHNVYGPNGTFYGGREKAPAAICRKIAMAKKFGHHEIEVWGDGEQTRSFMYIDDCLTGIDMILNGEYLDPINLGSSELVSVNQLVAIVEGIAGVKVKRNHDLSAPQGVRGRNSDNSTILSEFGWEPSISLQTGLESTYKWIYDHIDEAI